MPITRPSSRTRKWTDHRCGASAARSASSTAGCPGPGSAGSASVHGRDERHLLGRVHAAVRHGDELVEARVVVGAQLQARACAGRDAAAASAPRRYLPAHARDHVGSPGGPEMLRWGTAPDPVAGPGRGARRRRRGRGQPRRPHAAPGPLPPAAGRVGDHRAGVLGARSPRSARASPAGRSATRCARCWPAAATPSRWPCPRAQLLPVPDGVDLVTAAGMPEVACTVWSNVVMTAAARGGRDVPRARRHRRHRHARDPGGEGARARGSRPPRARRDRLDVLPRAGRRHRDRLPRRGLRRVRRHRRAAPT